MNPRPAFHSALASLVLLAALLGMIVMGLRGLVR